MKKFVVASPSIKSVKTFKDMYGGFWSRSPRWCIANIIYRDVYTDLIPGGFGCLAHTDDLMRYFQCNAVAHQVVVNIEHYQF